MTQDVYIIKPSLGCDVRSVVYMGRTFYVFRFNREWFVSIVDSGVSDMDDAIRKGMILQMVAGGMPLDSIGDVASANVIKHGDPS